MNDYMGDTIMASVLVDTFETTLQKTNQWLVEIMDELQMDDPHKAYLVLRSVLHALRDRLPVAEAVDFGAQLPMLIRGIYYEGWSLSGKPLKLRTKNDFFVYMCSEFGFGCDFDPELATQAVFRVISRKITAGEIHDIKQNLPEALKELWP
jgi:uncharacterized protein (DUF2267 family)